MRVRRRQNIPRSVNFPTEKPPKTSGAPPVSPHNLDLCPGQAHYSCWVFHSTSKSICRPGYRALCLSPFVYVRVRKFRTLKYRHKISLGATKKMPTSYIIFDVVTQKLIKRIT